MSRKQAVTHDSSAAAAPARAAKPTTPRVKSAKHSKSAAVTAPAAPELTAASELTAAELTAPELRNAAIVPEPAILTEAAVESEPFARQALAPENAREEIARIAYGFWLERGCTGGDPIEDWVRAENEYRRRIAV